MHLHLCWIIESIDSLEQYLNIMKLVYVYLHFNRTMKGLWALEKITIACVHIRNMLSFRIMLLHYHVSLMLHSFHRLLESLTYWTHEIYGRKSDRIQLGICHVPVYFVLEAGHDGHTQALYAKQWSTTLFNIQMPGRSSSKRIFSSSSQR